MECGFFNSIQAKYFYVIFEKTRVVSGMEKHGSVQLVEQCSKIRIFEVKIHDLTPNKFSKFLTIKNNYLFYFYNNYLTHVFMHLIFKSF